MQEKSTLPPCACLKRGWRLPSSACGHPLQRLPPALAAMALYYCCVCATGSIWCVYVGSVSAHGVHCRMGESRAGLEGLILLLKRIRLVAERNAASPAERLLDDALRLLQLSTGLADAQDYEEVSAPHLSTSSWVAQALSSVAPALFAGMLAWRHFVRLCHVVCPCYMLKLFTRCFQAQCQSKGGAYLMMDAVQEVKYRLQAAFQLPGHTDSGPVDVFAAAALLAAGLLSGTSAQCGAACHGVNRAAVRAVPTLGRGGAWGRWRCGRRGSGARVTS